MALNSLFEIRRVKPGGTISGLMPASALPIGTPMVISAKDADTGENTFAVAAVRADGFLTRAVRTTEGATDAELANESVGLTAGDNGDFVRPFVGGKPGSIEQALELEVEGTDYLTVSTGTGGISTLTAAGTKLSFASGKFRVAQSNDLAQYLLIKQMTPTVAGNVRIYVKAIEGYNVP